MNEVKQFEAKNVETAIQKACSFFGKEQEDLEIEIIDSGSSGIFGLGGRNSVIAVNPKQKSNEIEELVRGVVQKLLDPIVQEPDLEIQTNKNRIHVLLDDSNNSGLVIGKEGQTISALEYLTNRIVSKQCQEKVFIQLDAGGYRDRRDENIRQKALFLAQRVKETGKAKSTKPMSSYHRRLVHMALQNDSDIITKSKGEGPLKRVLILSKKKRTQKRPHEE
jgi:spoIIIJ-associated protein